MARGPKPSSPLLRATGPSILRIGFDPAEIAKLRPEERQDIAYHLVRLLSGEGSAESEWIHAGMRVDLRPWKRG